MDYKIIWTNKATFDLKEICSYIARDTPDTATRLGEGPMKQADILISFPEIGSPYRRKEHQAFRELTYRQYRIIYQVSKKPSEIHILHLWHSARDEPQF